MRRNEWLIMASLLLVGLFAAILLAGCAETMPTVVSQAEASIPDAAPLPARRYRDTLVRNARVVWGMDAPVAMLGAQVEQESGWVVDARSPVGATGLGQFMPATADWIDDAYPDLGPAQPMNPDWALRALTRYDKHLYDRVRQAATDCDRFAFTLSAYNGGEKWVGRDRELAAIRGLDPTKYFASVETVNAGRNPNAWRESRNYIPAILKRQPHYATWGRRVCTEIA